MSETLLSKKTPPYLSETDIVHGMEAVSGYVDLTPQDFRELYITIYTMAYERILQERTAQHIMTTPAFTINSNSSIGDCIALLANQCISGAPVVEMHTRITGIVSEKDILRFLGKGMDTHLMQLIDDSTRQPLHPSAECLHKSVTTIMSSPVITATPQTNLGELARIFDKRAINRLPIVDADGTVLGMITRADLIRAISEAV